MHDVSTSLVQTVPTHDQPASFHQPQGQEHAASAAISSRVGGHAVPCQPQSWLQLDTGAQLQQLAQTQHMYKQAEARQSLPQTASSQDSAHANARPRPSQAQQAVDWAARGSEAVSEAGAADHCHTSISMQQQPLGEVPDAFQAHKMQNISANGMQLECRLAAHKRHVLTSMSGHQQPSSLCQQESAADAHKDASCAHEGQHPSNVDELQQELADLRTNNEALVGMVERERQRSQELAERLQQAEADVLEVGMSDMLNICVACRLQQSVVYRYVHTGHQGSAQPLHQSLSSMHRGCTRCHNSAVQLRTVDAASIFRR